MWRARHRFARLVIVVLHQVLQWHNLIRERIPSDDVAGVQANVLWDGVFHLAVTAVVVAGVAMVWRSRHNALEARHDRELWWRVLVG